MPAVSILVPTYNRKDYLKECLDSLLTTTVPCEIIVADNASDDGTEALMATYTDPRIRYHRHPVNTGGFDNYNFLLSKASMDYICLFGDDDIILPGCFEKKLAVLDNNPHIDGVYSPSWVLDAAGNLTVSVKVNGMPRFSFVSGRDEFQHLIVNCCISWQTLVFRRELYDIYGPVKYEGQPRYATDWDYLIEISKGRQFACINAPTVAVRIHAGSGGNLGAVNSGALAEDPLHIWQKWLLDSEDYPVITESTWIVMANMLTTSVKTCYGSDELQLQHHLSWFERIKQAYHQRMERHFHAQLQAWVPEQVELDEQGLPRYRPGLPRLDLDSVKQLHFFHQITPQTPWQKVLSTYAQAFTADDDLELILWSDPDQTGITPEMIDDAFSTYVQEAGRDPAAAPDILLLTDPLTPDQLASLYASAHVIVPAGDPVQLDRGARLNKVVMTHTTPEAWRQVTTVFTGFQLASVPQAASV